MQHKMIIGCKWLILGGIYFLLFALWSETFDAILNKNAEKSFLLGAISLSSSIALISGLHNEEDK